MTRDSLAGLTAGCSSGDAIEWHYREEIPLSSRGPYGTIEAHSTVGRAEALNPPQGEGIELAGTVRRRGCRD